VVFEVAKSTRISMGVGTLRQRAFRRSPASATARSIESNSALASGRCK